MTPTAMTKAPIELAVYMMPAPEVLLADGALLDPLAPPLVAEGRRVVLSLSVSVGVGEAVGFVSKLWEGRRDEWMDVKTYSTRWQWR